MHLDVLRPDTRNLFNVLNNQPFIGTFYLVGGTAASLFLGHRESEDLDFFCADDLDGVNLRRELAAIGNLQVTAEARGTMHVILDGVKLSFLQYPYPLLYPLHRWNHCFIADIKEIALMKVAAIASRGSRKDFIDLYIIAREVWPLSEILQAFARKYAATQYDPYHVRKSLVWFEDAEQDAWPVLHRPIKWEELKAFFVEQARKL